MWMTIFHGLEDLNTQTLNQNETGWHSGGKHGQFNKLLKVVSWRHKVCGPYAVTLLYRTPIFEWYMARLVVKNGHQNDTCYNAIGLCAQNLHTNLG